ncbi:MAG: hypothetical protein IJA74_03825 [Oscillospiraceae bacterium]|nr:hypothetical protein [Oscillospiraceae bacterium]
MEKYALTLPGDFGYNDLEAESLGVAREPDSGDSPAGVDFASLQMLESSRMALGGLPKRR